MKKRMLSALLMVVLLLISLGTALVCEGESIDGSMIAQLSNSYGFTTEEWVAYDADFLALSRYWHRILWPNGPGFRLT